MPNKHVQECWGYPGCDGECNDLGWYSPPTIAPVRVLKGHVRKLTSYFENPPAAREPGIESEKPMIGTDYRAFVRTTGPDGTLIPLANAALGLVGELTELDIELDSDRTPLLEIGDVLYYIAAIAERKEIPDQVLWKYHAPSSYGEHSRSAGLLADVVKKECFHGQTPPIAIYATHLACIWDCMTNVAQEYGFTIDDVKEANIQKLKSRWPVGFAK